MEQAYSNAGEPVCSSEGELASSSCGMEEACLKQELNSSVVVLAYSNEEPGRSSCEVALVYSSEEETVNLSCVVVQACLKDFRSSVEE